MIKGELAISDFMPSEEKCFEHLRQIRWYDCVVCPICSSTEVKKNGTENGKQRYYCYNHKGTFRDTTGTIFSGSKIPLNYWYYFIFYYLQNHSTNQLSQVLGISYKTALGMARKIQKCLKGTCDGIELSEIIEFDELYLSVGEKGNSELSRPPRKRGLKLRGRGTMDKDKPPIIGGCDRNGNIRLAVLDHVDSDAVFTFLLTVVAMLSNMLKIFTDDFTAYIFLRKTWVQYESVNHSAGEYARGEVHNNTMEGYWSVHRHWMNTYRGVSKKYLPEYTLFFEFVENNKRDGWLTLLDKVIFLVPISLQQRIRKMHIQPHINLYNFNIIYPDNHTATFSFT
jgi:transposase-like protein